MKFFKEPFVQFLIIGMGIFLLNHMINRNDASENEIIITNDDIARLQLTYEQNWNRKPDSTTTTLLIQELIDSEILFQEALKLNLDHNDEIIKRRLRQKYEFIAQDIAALDEPDEQELKDFFAKNSDRYVSPRQLSFVQLYCNPDIHNDVKNAADVLLRKVQRQTPDQLQAQGDSFHLPETFELQNDSQVTKNFGRAFADNLFQVASTGWQDPIQSGFGWHIVHINEIIESSALPYESVRDQVIEDWRDDNEEYFMNQLIEKLRTQYKVVRDYEM